VKTLGKIIEEVRDGKRPDCEDLRYAVCAMQALATFNSQALMKLGQAEKQGKQPSLTSSAQWQWAEHLRRTKAAMEKAPKEYVGWNNDPENPEFLKRRVISQKIMEKVIQKKQ
jgi:hypothetical protein